MECVLQPRGEGTCGGFKTRYRITRFWILRDVSGRSKEEGLKREETGRENGQAQLCLPAFLRSTCKPFP